MASRSALTLSRLRGRPSSRAVGIIANEFFDSALGRMGGFGWAARSSAECLADAPSLGHRPVFLAGKGGLGRRRPERHETGFTLIRFDDSATRYSRVLDHAHVRLFLTIDFRPNYLPVLEARDVPTIFWIRDPRSPADQERISALELPSGAEPDGVSAIDCRSLGEHTVRTAAAARVVFASPAPGLATARMQATYGVDIDRLHFLPNPVPVRGDTATSERPRVVFLGRLDPIKRPWVFVELARRFPSVEFTMLGRPHFSGPGAWHPGPLPSNVSLLGHVDGAQKRAILESAWMIVNTSIHESLPISFLEALHCATPIVSCQDPEGVTSRFGSYVGQWGESGMDALNAFSDGVERLLDDRDLRLALGTAGREWARSHHTPEAFLTAFAALAGSLDG